MISSPGTLSNGYLIGPLFNQYTQFHLATGPTIAPNGVSYCCCSSEC